MRKRISILLLAAFTSMQVLADVVYQLDPATASLKGSAKVQTIGSYSVVNLGSSSGYIDLGKDAGTAFAALSNFSISCYYYVESDASLSGNGYFLWSYSTSTACQSTSGIYHAYRLNAQRFATTTGGYSNEKGYSVGTASAQGQWVHVCYTQSGTTGTLYLNGEKAGSTSGVPAPSTAFTTAPAYNWIGRAPFSGDNYLANTLVYGYTLYNTTLSATEIAALSAETSQLEEALRYGTAGDFTALSAAVAEADAFLAAVEEGTYPQAAVDNYTDVVEYCRALIQQGTVSQAFIDEALATLKTTYAALKSSKGFVFDYTATEGYDTNRGFRHPGGLHTASDFERIRQQLADGNATVTAAYNTLCNAGYAQTSASTSPVETIVRGGGSGENYMNAARGATIAYQNALRWQISGNELYAKHAVEVLMAWANTTKAIGGDSNYALAAGLYGYQFAQAAELVRDYEGWAAEDFDTFKQWMLNVWYPYNIGFLRGRNGTWENSGKWWQSPGHYWSNWGLCTALAVASIGVLCDDVYIYNQGMSFFKHDQVGTFTDPRTAVPILNDGLNEFLGNLVVTTTEWDGETGAYGKVGQMQESGRDIGHATMALGLAVDMAHQGWNQGDDLFSYMDNRLAAGIEYVAGQIQSIDSLPWTNYHYASSGYYWSDSRAWLQTEPALGSQIRPYWGTVIGHYEGVKGVKMPLSETVYKQMGIDGGGLGSTSGGYDHLGYSVLLNTRNGIAAENEVPTLLTPTITCNGETLQQSDLGGLYNPYWNNGTTAVDGGSTALLSVTLPEGEENTGKWQWNTGETTQSITVPTDKSYAYRVTYTNANGIQSERLFTIAAKGDCEQLSVKPYYTLNGETVYDTRLAVPFGSSVTLGINATGGFGSYEWENGATTATLTLPAITRNRDLCGAYINHGGRRTLCTFHITVNALTPSVIVNGVTTDNTSTVVVGEHDNLTLQVTPFEVLSGGTYRWSDGSTANTLELGTLSTSGTYQVTYEHKGNTYTLTFEVYVNPSDKRLLESGNYRISLRTNGTLLTNQGIDSTPSFETEDTSYPETQQWYLYRSSAKYPYYELRSLVDSSTLNVTGLMVKRLYTRPYRIVFAAGTDYATIYTNADENPYITVDAEGVINFAGSNTLYDFPFLVEAADDETSLQEVLASPNATSRIYDLQGRYLGTQLPLRKGIYIQNGRKVVQ